MLESGGAKKKPTLASPLFMTGNALQVSQLSCILVIMPSGSCFTLSINFAGHLSLFLIFQSPPLLTVSKAFVTSSLVEQRFMFSSGYFLLQFSCRKYYIYSPSIFHKATLALQEKFIFRLVLSQLSTTLVIASILPAVEIIQFSVIFTRLSVSIQFKSNKKLYCRRLVENFLSAALENGVKLAIYTSIRIFHKNKIRFSLSILKK